MVKKGQVIYFDNDDEFYNFVVVPQLHTVPFTGPDGKEMYMMDFDLSNNYNKALSDGLRFVIKDEDSRIYRHGCVSYRTISKDIQNLDPWYDDYD